MKDPKNEHLKITENEGAATPSGKGDFSKGRVPFLILRLGLPIMLAEIVNVRAAGSGAPKVSGLLAS